jgi:hypothetical protein
MTFNNKNHLSKVNLLPLSDYYKIDYKLFEAKGILNPTLNADVPLDLIGN